MSKYLISAVDTYRVGTVGEVEALHDALLKDKHFTLVEYSYKTKEIKNKGEVVEEYQLVKAKKIFNDEKDPDNWNDVFYGVKENLLTEWQQEEKEIMF